MRKRSTKRIAHMTRADFGKYLAAIRKKSGFSQVEWSAKVGLLLHDVKTLELGHKTPTVPMESKLSKIYKIDKRDITGVYNYDKRTSNQDKKLDAIITEFRRNKSTPFRGNLSKAVAEKPGLETKRLLMKLYKALSGFVVVRRPAEK